MWRKMKSSGRKQRGQVPELSSGVLLINKARALYGRLVLHDAILFLQFFHSMAANLLVAPTLESWARLAPLVFLALPRRSVVIYMLWLRQNKAEGVSWDQPWS